MPLVGLKHALRADAADPGDCFRAPGVREEERHLPGLGLPPVAQETLLKRLISIRFPTASTLGYLSALGMVEEVVGVDQFHDPWGVAPRFPEPSSSLVPVHGRTAFRSQTEKLSLSLP
jgi:hypothetical protein